MFGIKCSKCGKKFGKKYEFCPYCGSSVNANKSDLGFLGKEDIKTAEDDFYADMPFPFKMMIKPLIKELDRQMSEIDKINGIKNEKEEIKRNSNASLSIFISAPGQKPIRINQVIRDGKAMPVMQQVSVPSGGVHNVENVKKELPKFGKGVKLNKLIKKEPEINVRRLSDGIIYEFSVPGVKSMKNVNVEKIEKGYEIKCFSDKELFAKTISVDLPLNNVFLEDDGLFIEFGLR